VNDAVRVVLADDHTLVRAGVRRILEAEPGFEVVAEVADGESALAAVARTSPDVLVLDLSMPGMDGLEVLRRTRERYPELRVLVLTMHAEAEYASRAVEAGADGYLLKDSAVQDLVAGIRTVMSGGAYYSPDIQRALRDVVRGGAAAASLLDVLTEREREVMVLVAEGLATKEIAARLGISARTVDTHRANLMRKLNVRSVALLTQMAFREGLVGKTPPER
jgi:DNA-binding NarL/FixJ family response regulator